MDSQKTVYAMNRYEFKYILSAEQTEYLKNGIKDFMAADEYGLTTISSLYYDTPDNRLIRSSIEKPIFKEKIRLRSYGRATRESKVFLELKRKSADMVYKRRIESTIPEAEAFFNGQNVISERGQIEKEITYFRDYYKYLKPAYLIIYDRIAYKSKDGSVRLTIDHAPRYRTTALDLTGSPRGENILQRGQTILEIKIGQAMPLWLSSILDKGKIYKTSFSKYGEAYKKQSELIKIFAA